MNKPIYDGKYTIDEDGNVSNNHGKTLRPTQDKDGYLVVGLYHANKRHWHSIHRLVAMAFIPNPDNLPEINHIDEDKTNNSVKNLEWCDRVYNVNYGSAIERRIRTRYNKVNKLK